MPRTTMKPMHKPERTSRRVLAAAFIGVIAMPHPGLAQDPPARAPGIAMLAVTSPAFAHDTPMPDSVRLNLLGCDGQNRSLGGNLRREQGALRWK